SSEGETVENVPLDELIIRSSRLACERYQLPDETVELKLEPAQVRGRSADLEIIFRNLLDNAIKYSGDKPHVDVETRHNGNGRVVALIGDNGPGIPAKLRRKIFGRFVRLGSELERTTPGTGLGLYIVRNLVRRIGGTIQVRSRSAGPGTIFEVELPAAS